MIDQQDRNDTYLELTAEIISAYVSNNAVPASELYNLIADIHKSLTTLASGEAEAPAEVLIPAVPIKKSVHADYIVCLEDGKKFKSMKRHLATHHGLTPEEYRAKWDLPSDYPMTARAYSEARSAMAKASGLGRKPAPEPVPAKRGRKPKAS